MIVIFSSKEGIAMMALNAITMIYLPVYVLFMLTRKNK